MRRSGVLYATGQSRARLRGDRLRRAPLAFADEQKSMCHEPRVPAARRVFFYFGERGTDHRVKPGDGEGREPVMAKAGSAVIRLGGGGTFAAYP